MKIVEPTTELLWITEDAEAVIEACGRTCYKSEGNITSTSHIDFIRKLIKNGHHAMLEHASASFAFVCDRGVSHELVRHRLCAYAQESTRWCNYGSEKFGNEISCIEPPGLTSINRIYWLDACAAAENTYMKMLQSGCSPQIARSVLPTCLKTEIVCTANLREWRHIFTLRLSSKAHPQIREIMYPALQLLNHHCPTVFEDILNNCTEGN